MQIDLKRFIESMYKYGQHNLSYSNAMVYALADQGYKFDDEHHVVPVEEIKGNNGGISPKFKVGGWVITDKKLSHSEEPPTVYRDELTKFDHKLCLMLQKFRYLDQPVTNGDILEYVEKNSKELQAIARKQIADKAIEFVKTHICMFKSMEEVDLFNELFEKNIKGE